MNILFPRETCKVDHVELFQINLKRTIIINGSIWSCVGPETPQHPLVSALNLYTKSQNFYTISQKLESFEFPLQQKKKKASKFEPILFFTSKCAKFGTLQASRIQITLSCSMGSSKVLNHSVHEQFAFSGQSIQSICSDFKWVSHQWTVGLCMVSQSGTELGL